jgi:hypothetical protein
MRNSSLCLSPNGDSDRAVRRGGRGTQLDGPQALPGAFGIAAFVKQTHDFRKQKTWRAGTGAPIGFRPLQHSRKVQRIDEPGDGQVRAEGKLFLVKKVAAVQRIVKGVDPGGAVANIEVKSVSIREVADL